MVEYKIFICLTLQIILDKNKPVSRQAIEVGENGNLHRYTNSEEVLLHVPSLVTVEVQTGYSCRVSVPPRRYENEADGPYD